MISLNDSVNDIFQVKMKKISILNFVIVHILISKLVNCEIPKTVVTKSGPIEGVQYVEPYTKKNLLEFRKIPFAMPPVGKRRFKHAIPYGKWILKLDATKFGPSCYQTLKNSALFLPTRDVSENCLFLNIYVPNNVSASNNYSIMVWFHGGDFTGGQGTSFNGALLAAIGDVIVVTINYRLGLFGFLSTGDKHAPGNLGLGDQVVAIHWIHRYIKDYGGNPKSITLFGQSSGAMSISFLSRKSSGMFQRIILQSGFATSPLSNARNTVKNTLLLAKQVECFQNTTKETMNCLRNKTSDQLQEGFKRLKHSVQNSLNLPMFGPVRLPRNMSHIFSNSHSYRNVDVLIGNVANEGTLFLNFVKSFENFQRDDEAQKHICRHTVQMMLVLLFNTSHNLDTKVCTEYVKTEGKSSYLLDLYGDLMFNVPTYSALKSHSEQGGLGRTFQYILNINTSILHASKLPSWVQSPTHGDDVLFLSGQLVDLSKSLKNLTITMMLYWTNFAKTG